jgi:predicted NBD/HSP70 family sugar kinase
VPRFGWRDLPLSQILGEHYGVSTYVANDSHLASMALFAFADEPQSGGLATVIVSQTVGVGIVAGETGSHYGSEIGYLRTCDMTTLDERLGWSRVRQRAGEIGAESGSPYLQQADLSYLNIRQGVENGDEGALRLQDELAEGVVEICAWIIALMRPQNIALSGKIANLGDPFLDVIVEKLTAMVIPRLIEETSFFVDDSPNLISVGAAANAIQQELGLAAAN